MCQDSMCPRHYLGGILPPIPVPTGKIPRLQVPIRDPRGVGNFDTLRRAPEPFPLRSSQASVPDAPMEAADRQSASRDGSSYNLSGVWQSQSSSPSS
ncbi:hypothetical protein PIB30_003912 [Stylosanthes scabra]|uniref:Uncharacterized protein n=1 Tax=Stylosanthes scabra TaxID=79078 RepID=A0ABU6U5I8_9FABA|nr:hypothetical protein [Stylosanthes scabra]